MSAPRFNKNARKPKSQSALDYLHCRAKIKDKNNWKAAAKAEQLTLAAWVTKVLNEQAGPVKTPTRKRPGKP